MRISRAHWDDLVAHAREEQPNECCGYLWVRDGVVAGVKRGVNNRHSPYGYELDSDSLFQAWKLEEDKGFQVGIYHSHPVSSAEPSQTDINLAKWSEWLYVIVGLKGEPGIQVWRIADGRVEEEELNVLDG